MNAANCRKTMAAWLTIVLLSSMLTTCGTLEIGVERTPTLDHAATVAALATENARLKTVLATVQATPASAGRVSPTPGATSTPGPIFATGFKAIAGSPPGTRLNQLLHEYEGISLGNWSPDGTHLVLYTPVGPLEGNQIPDAEPMIVDVESGVAWRTGDSGLYPYGDRFTWLPDGSVLFVAGGELWRAQADGQDRRLLTEAVADAIIAFSLSPDGSTVLAQGERQYWLVLTDGGVSQTVTDLPGGSGGRSWSPDGTRIALWHKDGTTYLIDPASATAHPLAETPVVGGWLVPPVWLANSQLFLNAPVYPHNRPALVDLESGAVRDLVSTLGLPEPEHVISQCYPSPDGKYMAITVADLDKFANMNYLWNIVTDELTEVGPPVDVFGGLWSPTGQQVVVLLGEGDEEILAVLDVSSSEVRRLAEPAWPPTEWTPDSTRIAFGSPEGEIWIVPTDGSGEAKRLLPSLSENPTLQWSSDGQRLAVAVEHHFGPFHEELYVVELASVAEETPALAVPEGQLAVLIGGPPLSLVNLAGGPPQTLGAGNIATYGALFFQWSPDGREIVYSADADLWLLDVESGESQNLTDNDRWDLMPAWSPDGDWIAFTSRPLLPDEGKADWMKGEWGGALAVIGANGAHFRILDDEGNVISPPSWAPTGRRLAYAADGELRLYDMDTSQRTVLSPLDFGLTDVAYMGDPIWSPDGHFIAAYFSHSAELAQWDALGAGTASDAGQGVVLLDLETQTARVLFDWETPFVGALTSLCWQPGGSLLLIDVQAASRVPQQAGLWLADPVTGEVTALPVAAYDADWSPDGRWIAAIDLDDRERLVLVDIEQPTAEAVIRRWPYGLEGLAWRPAVERTPTPAPSPTATPRAATEIAWHSGITVTAVLSQLLPVLPAWSPDGKTISYIGQGGQLVLASAPDFVPEIVSTSSPGAGSLWSPSVLWQPDGSRLVFVTGAEREIEGQTYGVRTLASVASDGSDYRDLLPGWRAAINGPSFAKSLVGWLDNDTLLFSAHCGTGCERLYAVDTINGQLLDLQAFGPTFHVVPGHEWIVAQHGPSGGFSFTLVNRQSATVTDDISQLSFNLDEAITRTLPLTTTGQALFSDWSPDGKRLLASVWSDGFLPLVHVQPDLYVWNIEDNSTRLFAPGAVDGTWSPDGRHVALLVPGQPRIEKGQIRGTDYVPGEPLALHTLIVDAETGKLVFFAQGETLAPEYPDYLFWSGLRRRPVWSRLGRYLAYWDAGSDLALYDTSLRVQRQVTQDSGALLLGAELEDVVNRVRVSFSPDERYVVLTYSDANLNSRLAIIEMP